VVRAGRGTATGRWTQLSRWMSTGGRTGATKEAATGGEGRKRRTRLRPDTSPTASFAELFRSSGAAYPVQRGTRMTGEVVGFKKGLAGPDKAPVVTMVDFGLKTEVPFNPREVPEVSKVSDEVTMPILDVENEFEEPGMDFTRSYSIGGLKAERLKLLRPPENQNIDSPPILYGRYVERRANSYKVKALGKEGFVATNHALRIGESLLGTYNFFALLRLETRMRTFRGDMQLRYEPVFSSYVAHVLLLSNVVLHDRDVPPKARLAYLKLLTRIVFDRNSLVRQHHNRNQRGRSAGPRWENFAEWFSSSK